MLVARAVRVAILAVVMLWQARGLAGAHTPTVRLCGRDLSKFMSKVCDSYNSPWNNAAVHSSGVIRHKREVGIADECCKNGCSWSQISQYCQIRNYSPDFQEPHQIADRSAEGTNAQRKVEEPPPVMSTGVKKVGRGEVGRTRPRGAS